VSLNFKYFVVLPNRKHKFSCTTKSKTLILSTPSSFDWSAKNRHASKIGSHPCGNHEPCLTTPECPGFRHHPRERPEFLSPLILLFLRFIDFLAAPKHCSNASTAFTGIRTGGRAGHSTRMPVFLWVAVACAARRYYAIIVILSTHISVVVWYQLPIHDGRASDEEK